MYSMGMAVLMRLSSHPLRKQSGTTCSSSMWQYKSLTYCQMAEQMLLQCTLSCQKPAKQTCLSSCSSIRPTRAQKARLQFLMWYSSTPATMLTPCTYPISKSYTEQATSTLRSICLNSTFLVKVGHYGCVLGRSFSICTKFSLDASTLSKFWKILKSSRSLSRTHSYFQGQVGPQRQPCSPRASLVAPHRKATLFQLNKGLMVLYSILCGGLSLMVRLGVRSILILLGELWSQFYSFGLVEARVERRLTDILSFGLIQLMRWEEAKDQKADTLEFELQQLLATERQSSSGSSLLELKVEQSWKEGVRGIMRDINEYKIIKYAKQLYKSPMQDSSQHMPYAFT